MGPRSPFQYKRSNPHLAVVKGLRSYNGSEELRNYLALTKNRKYFVCKAGRPRCEAGRPRCRSCNKKCPAPSSFLRACWLGGVDCNTQSLGGVLLTTTIISTSAMIEQETFLSFEFLMTRHCLSNKTHSESISKHFHQINLPSPPSVTIMRNLSTNF